MSHVGPTSATSPTLSPRIQYWTSRGIAVLDVNYGGSIGFGRDYRRRLNRRWGLVDVLDCANAARYVTAQGLADPNRVAITGGSAGGFTTLAALAFTDVFRAGASHYGVADLEALAQDTHKFESRYLDNLIAPYTPAAPRSSEATPEAGAVGAQPPRGESEGSPLGSSSLNLGVEGEPSPSDAPSPEAGAVGVQPPRGESEGSPLSSPQNLGVRGGPSPSDAQPDPADAQHPEAGVSRGRSPMRGESEGSPLRNTSSLSGRGAAQGDAQREPSGLAPSPGPQTRASTATPEGRGGPPSPYVARSPIHHVDRLNCPVIFFQGLEDQVVPPNQAETMVAALRRKGVDTTYIPFEGEQHGFRRAENIKRSLEEELLFYGRIFGFDAKP
jgi:dienelactone hydrolase